jgi:hypothetical protein
MENSNSNMERSVQAQFLISLKDLTEYTKQGDLKTEIAGVVVNCPFVKV